MIRVNVTRADATVTERETLTAGRVGLRCAFSFDEAWDGLVKTAVFEGAERKDVVMLSDTVTIPWECLAEPGYKLMIGVYGKLPDGTIAIPTIWANAGKIANSAQPSGEEGAEPTPDVVAQIQQNSANALMLSQRMMQMAENGEFDGTDGRDGATGPIGPQGIQGPKGDAYVLTAADRAEIAEIASDDVLVVSDEEPTTEPLPKIWIDSDDDSTILLPTMEDIGDLSDLVTTAKDNLVAAINEAAQSGGGGGTGDYDDLINQPQINGTELTGNKSASDLGLAPAGAYVKPSGGIPASDLASAVQTSLGKADTALQSYTETDPTVPSWAKASSKPAYTASEVGAVASNQGVANANKVLTVNSSGVVVPEDTRFVVTLTPTSPDYSGVMDKTPEELAAAYEAGKRIIAYAPAFNFRSELSLATIKSGGLYTFDFIALGELNGQDIMLRLLTYYSSDSTYAVKIYPLASGQWTGGSY